MSTAQMTQAAPRMMTDIHPPTANPQQPQPDAMQAEIVQAMPVQDPNAHKSVGFNPIMSAEHHNSKSAFSDHVLSEASHAVQSEQSDHPGKKSDKSITSGGYKPKPILETVLLITGCIIACAIVFITFSSN